MRAVLLDARAVVHEHEVELRPRTAGPLRLERGAGGRSIGSRCQPRSVARACSSAASAVLRAFPVVVRPASRRGRATRPPRKSTTRTAATTISTIASVDMRRVYVAPAQSGAVAQAVDDGRRGWTETRLRKTKGRPGGRPFNETAATYSPRAARPKYHRR